MGQTLDDLTQLPQSSTPRYNSIQNHYGFETPDPITHFKFENWVLKSFICRWNAQLRLSCRRN